MSIWGAGPCIDSFSWTLNTFLNSCHRKVLIQLVLKTFFMMLMGVVVLVVVVLLLLLLLVSVCWRGEVEHGENDFRKKKNWQKAHGIFPKFILGGGSHPATQISLRKPRFWICFELTPRCQCSNVNALILNVIHLVSNFLSDFLGAPKLQFVKT